MMLEYFNDPAYGWGHPVWWMLLQAIVLITAMVLVVLKLQKGAHGNGNTRQASPTARQILDERYAKVKFPIVLSNYQILLILPYLH